MPAAAPVAVQLAAPRDSVWHGIYALYHEIIAIYHLDDTL
jgi:hypothetical protein